MATPLDGRERRELCELFDSLGPNAPTLCGDWTTADLAAHLVVRERDPRAIPGILFGDRFSAATEAAMAWAGADGYETVVDRVRSGPPLLPWRLPVVRSLLNLNEFFVHHEDVRRANGLGPRTDAALSDGLRPVVRRMAAVQLWRSKTSAELQDADGVLLARRGIAAPVIRGEPGELVLWLNGRGAVADLIFEGSEDAVAALWTAELSL